MGYIEESDRLYQILSEVDLITSLVLLPISVSTLLYASTNFIYKRQFLSQWKFITLLLIMVVSDIATVLYLMFYVSQYSQRTKHTIGGWLLKVSLFTVPKMSTVSTLLFVQRYYESVTSFINQKSWVTNWAIPIVLYLIYGIFMAS